MSISPESGCMNPIIRFSIVVLPAPDSPTNATVSPGFTWRLNPLRTILPSSLYANFTFLKSNSPAISLSFGFEELSSMSLVISTSPTEVTDSKPLEIIGSRLRNCVIWPIILPKYV